MSGQRRSIRGRWRAYTTRAGRSPLADFLADLPDQDAAELLAAMKEVSMVGLSAARHLRGDIWEVRSFSDTRGYRVLFSREGNKGRILLALAAFSKKTQKTPDRLLLLAERRLADWRNRGGGG
ncbi:MAG: type II toxin-antitoxin system RelE/ParE family toxin [Actinomycetota bacterium]